VRVDHPPTVGEAHHSEKRLLERDDVNLIRHCERSAAIQGVLIRPWIASLRSQ